MSADTSAPYGEMQISGMGSDGFTDLRRLSAEGTTTKFFGNRGYIMRKITLLALAAAACFAAVAPAEARDGCGIGFHRGPYGACRPNRGPVVVVPAGPRYGAFYPGRGYWDGRRYWMHRERWHGGWRYR